MGIVMLVAAVMVASLAVPGLANTSEPGADAGVRPATAEPNAGQVVRPATDQRVQPPPATDVRPLVRDRCDVDPRPARCPDRVDQVNIRHLIWRLVKAGEWRMLFHLLNRLGII